MKNQIDWKSWLTLGILIFAVFKFIIMDTEPTYTQSDVSAFAKLTGGIDEFSDSYVCNNYTKVNGVLQATCKYRSCPVCLFKQMIYFSQFANVSVVVEPERQECPDNLTVWAVYGIDERGNKITDFSYWCSDNQTRPQTIPPVTKQINPWAVDENDLATEFCRAKTYQAITRGEVVEFWFPERLGATKLIRCSSDDGTQKDFEVFK